MSLKSIIGSTPWLKKFMPSVTRQTLPVRSPWPNRQPSTRSAPAIIASSVAATAVPRSLCGCSEMTVFSRRVSCAPEPLDLVGVDVGRRHLDRGRQVEDDLAAVLWLPDVGHRLAHLDRERQLGAGEDLRASTRSRSRCLAGSPSAYFITISVPRVAIALISSRSTPNTTRRNSGAVRCTGGRSRDRRRPGDCTVRSIRSSRACVSTEIVTSSGIWSPSIS